MVTFTSKEAKEKFGALVDAARREPVTITKHNRPTVVVISSERYAELEAMEDEAWAAKAREAEKKGYLGVEESEAAIQRILNAEA
jgi:antitoxin Phd